MTPETEKRGEKVEWTADRCSVMEGGKEIANCGVYSGLEGPETMERMARARLMASAPDLLAACKAFADGNLHDDKVLRLAKEAIAKAESSPSRERGG